METLTRSDILRLFELLSDELESTQIIGEIYLVGGAVMCLVHNARVSTKDVDAIFKPSSELRLAAQRVGDKAGVGRDWLNDAVKGYLSEKSAFAPYCELRNLRVFYAQPEYLLAMKCLAMRIGKEFHDESDVRFLLRYLNINQYDQAMSIITRYYPQERFPQKTLYALEELLSF